MTDVDRDLERRKVEALERLAAAEERLAAAEERREQRECLRRFLGLRERLQEEDAEAASRRPPRLGILR